MCEAELEATKEHLEECRAQNGEQQLAISQLRIELHDKQSEINFLEERAAIEIKLNRALVRLNQDSSNTYKILKDMNRVIHDQPAPPAEIVSQLKKEVSTRGHELEILNGRIQEKDEQIETLKVCF